MFPARLLPVLATLGGIFAVIGVSLAPASAEPPSAPTATTAGWKHLRIDDVFRSEGVAAFDVNGDGKLDVVTGDLWYEAPDWIHHEIRKPGKFDPATGYSQSFANWGYDVNRDGRTDLICVGFPGAPCHWYENPGKSDTHWPAHEIWHSACNETPLFQDVTGDGKPELILGTQPEGQLGYLEIPPPKSAAEKWKFTAVSERGTKIGTERFYHGLGVGDLNSDGRHDLLTPDGWWEHPPTLDGSTWKFHALQLPKPNPAKTYGLQAANLFAADLDRDGDADLLCSSAHRTGIWWFENIGSNAEPRFAGHIISEAFSQTHALDYVDINGDGERDLVTGKRFYAHGPKGDDEPLAEVVMYWFEIHTRQGAAPRFIPHKIAAGSGTGVGTQFQVIDFNGDHRLDIVLSNKKGTHVLLQEPAGK